jgi:hypothetical protein
MSVGAIHILWLRELKKFSRSRAQIIASLGQPQDRRNWKIVGIYAEDGVIRCSVCGGQCEERGSGGRDREGSLANPTC